MFLKFMVELKKKNARARLDLSDLLERDLEAQLTYLLYVATYGIEYESRSLVSQRTKYSVSKVLSKIMEYIGEGANVKDIERGIENYLKRYGEDL